MCDHFQTNKNVMKINFITHCWLLKNYVTNDLKCQGDIVDDSG